MILASQPRTVRSQRRAYRRPLILRAPLSPLPRPHFLLEHQVELYTSRVNLWRPSEAQKAIDGLFGGIIWTPIDLQVPCLLTRTPSYYQPAVGFVEQNIPLFQDKFHFPADVDLAPGDVIHRVAGPKLLAYWMCDGAPEYHNLYLNYFEVRSKMLPEGAPPGVGN